LTKPRAPIILVSDTLGKAKDNEIAILTKNTGRKRAGDIFYAGTEAAIKYLGAGRLLSSLEL
jgi:hypothetical protein